MVIEKTDFISEKENFLLLSLLEKKLVDEILPEEQFYIWKELSTEEKGVGHPLFIGILNKILSFAKDQSKQNLKLHYFGYAIQTKGFDYHADSVWPEKPDDRFLGVPKNDSNTFINYSGNWAPNPYPTREFTTVLYLNDEVIGGETHFPTLDILVKPERNKIVGFGCDENYIHGVMPTTSGIRKTFICWFEKPQLTH